MFSGTLDKFVSDLSTMDYEIIDRNNSDKIHDQINTKNFAQLTKGIVNYANSRLQVLRTQLDAVHTLLPSDKTESGVQVFMLPLFSKYPLPPNNILGCLYMSNSSL